MSAECIAIVIGGVAGAMIGAWLGIRAAFKRAMRDRS